MSENQLRQVGKVQFYGWIVLLTGSLLSGLALPGGAQESEGVEEWRSGRVRGKVSTQFRDRDRPATTVKEWISQIEAATTQVTGIRLNRTETGLEIVLETAEGKPLPIDATQFRSEGNSFIADIPNAVLVLPDSQEFNADNPTDDVAMVRVVQQGVSSIRVSVTGTEALPESEVTLRTGDYAYSLNPELNEPDDEIVVTGDRPGSRYAVPNASTATRTDTPLRDIPQSIQVVPRQILEDQQSTSLEEALRNVSGVRPENNNVNVSNQATFNLRGFRQDSIFRNGFPTRSNGLIEIAGIERIEVLKGPASIL